MQYPADRDVLKVNWFQEMTAEVAKPYYCQDLTVTKTCQAVSDAYLHLSHSEINTSVKKCPFKRQCPVSSPFIILSWFLLWLNNCPALSNMLLPDLSSFKNFTQHRTVLSYQLFWTTYRSQLHEAGSPRRPATFRYAVYMVWIVNGSQNVMLANRVNGVWGRQREERSRVAQWCSEITQVTTTLKMSIKYILRVINCLALNVRYGWCAMWSWENRMATKVVTKNMQINL